MDSDDGILISKWSECVCSCLEPHKKSVEGDGCLVNQNMIERDDSVEVLKNRQISEIFLMILS